jgi:ribosome-associated protein
VRRNLVIPERELEVRTSRSGGPGGQNVNKLSTRVEVRFDLAGSEVLSAAQKKRVRERLAQRVSRAGVLRVVSQKHRTRARNEAEARERLSALLRQALHVPRKRVTTRPTASSRERRRREKERRARLKRQRRRPSDADT